MARIELIEICKRYTDDDRSSLGDSIFPLGRIVKDIRLGMTDDYREVPFSIENLNLAIPDGKIMVILGPTGCGKTTLLRIIAGLIQPDSGEVRYDGVDMGNIPPGERRIGMVFQNYALYPHFTSKKNILSYFLFRKKTPELDELASEKYRKTSELLGVDIAYLLDKKPTHLSAGEKQRVALGRCITRDPALFLLDEPFSNLDQRLRERYRVNLKILLKRFNITTVYVTHDQQEALILADSIAIMNIGRIEQVGTYEEIYNKPKSILVAEFLNLDMHTPAINLIDGGYISREFNGMIVGVRPENIEVCRDEKENCISGAISNVLNIPTQNTTILSVKTGECEVYARGPSSENLSIDDEIWLRLKSFHIFDRNLGLRVQSHLERL